jgi:hypothetical protein
MKIQLIILTVVIGAFSTAIFLKDSEIKTLKKDKTELIDKLSKANVAKQKLQSDLFTAQQSNDQLVKSLATLSDDAVDTLQKKASWCLNRVSEVRAGLAVPPRKVYVKVPAEVRILNEQTCPLTDNPDVYILRDLLLAGRKTNSSN